MAQDPKPVHALVISKYATQLNEAHRAFEAKYGTGLLDLTIAAEVPEGRDLTSNDVVYLQYYVWSDRMSSFAAAARAAEKRGTVFGAIITQNLERNWHMKSNPALAKGEAYLRMGGEDNLVSFLALLYRAGGGKAALKIPSPKSQLKAGIYHPRADHVFSSLPEYLSWYRAEGRYQPGAPLVGITFYPNEYNFHDLAHIDALIAAVEKRGLGAVPIFGWPLPTLSKLLEVNGECPFSVLLSLNLTMPNFETTAVFEKYRIHVINLIVSTVSRAEWESSNRGLLASRINTNLNTPERVGASEPLLIATSEKSEDGQSTLTVPVPDRIEAAASRAQRWATLRNKPNSAKRLVLIYYNNPPGKGNLGASYLDLPHSLDTIVHRLAAEGYRVGDNLPDEQQLLQLLKQSGRNIESWSPGELEEMVSSGHVVLLPVSRYRRWFNKLPEPFRDAVVSRWGEPEKSKFMTVNGPAGKRCFVIPGIRLGNLFLGPQPLRTTFEEAAQTAHDTVTPVPHQYVAAYLWYRHEFGADAIVHMGRHGTLEWLPGKDVAQAGWDHSEVLLGDLPDIYYYIIDGGAEAIQAQRRGAAVLISHLTPMIAAAGKDGDLAPLQALMDNLERGDQLSPALAEQYRNDAEREIARLRLCEQLGIDRTKLSQEQVLAQVGKFLRGIEEAPVPLGLHSIGSLPALDVQRAALEELIRSGLDESERKDAGDRVQEWARHIMEGTPAVVPLEWAAERRKRIDARLAEAANWWRDLQRSPDFELDNFIAALNGRYVPTGLLGDPLRTPAVLPSGRNLHDFDIRAIPTKPAWELGKKMADQLIAQFQREQGHVPQKVSLVLWYGEANRNQGAMEAEALYLMGVEPVWSARGVPDQLKLIPLEQLGRPRVDVLLTISGIYRDGMQEKILMLDQAARMAAEAPGPNVLREHNRAVAEALEKGGLSKEKAEAAAKARVFGAAPGAYGVGMSRMVEQSSDARNSKAVVDSYLRNMNFLYTKTEWGEEVPGALAAQLTGNEAAIQSRSTNVYGVVDNDDVFQFLGGLNLATKEVTGAAPQMFINNLRVNGKESMQEFRNFLATELNARLWNPLWIKEMQKSGYAGARQFGKEVENLYGFQATAPKQMSGEFWQNTYDVYVADKHGLKMEEFFARENPYAQQTVLARLLEVDRQGSYRFSEQDRARMLSQYVRSVAANGVGCSPNTCGNLRLNQYVAQQAALVPGLGTQELRLFATKMVQATHWSARQFPMAYTAFPGGLRPPSTKQEGPASTARKNEGRAPARNKDSNQNRVTGLVMSESTLTPQAKPSPRLFVPWVLLMALLAMLCGALWRRRTLSK